MARGPALLPLAGCAAAPDPFAQEIREAVDRLPHSAGYVVDYRGRRTREEGPMAEVAGRAEWRRDGVLKLERGESGRDDADFGRSHAVVRLRIGEGWVRGIRIEATLRDASGSRRLRTTPTIGLLAQASFEDAAALRPPDMKAGAVGASREGRR